MRFDLSPLYRSTVGFDSLVSMLDQVASFNSEATLIRPTTSSVLPRTSTASPWRLLGLASKTSRLR
jgi:hypothetical protein